MLDLGLEDNVEFDDRFLSIEEIADLLAATDVFVTPYREREQIASGALTFGIAAGCGVISTPYWYAQDMLGSGAGTIVPFADPGALADAVCRYIDDPDGARRRARRSAAHRRPARLAVGRGGDRGGPARGGRARTAPAPAGLGIERQLVERADGSSPAPSSTTSGSCSTRTASSRTARGLLRRRCRPARGRRARARPSR